MPVTLHKDAGLVIVQLSECADITIAAELKKVLLEAFQLSTAVRIDLSGVNALDITAVQLLWAAERHASSMGVCITGAPPTHGPVTTSLQELGLDLPAWTVEPSSIAETH